MGSCVDAAEVPRSGPPFRNSLAYSRYLCEPNWRHGGLAVRVGHAAIIMAA
jgi:hypothetical protein